jgi:hypothetical protein
MYSFFLWVSKKTEKPRKLEKTNQKNRTVKKNPIKILKKLAGMVQFRFYKPEIKKNEPNSKQKKTEPNQKKPSQTE